MGTHIILREAAQEIDYNPRTCITLREGFDPDQPRVDAGSPDGGQWTAGGGVDRRASSGRHHTLTMPHEIVRETEKAVAIKNHALQDARDTAHYDVKELSSSQVQMLRDNAGQGTLTWLPKSQIHTRDGKVVSMQRWLADKHKLGTIEGIAARDKAFAAGSQRYNDLLAQAKAAGVKGVRVGMRTTTIKEKMIAHGMQVGFHEADEGLDIMAGIVRLN